MRFFLFILAFMIFANSQNAFACYMWQSEERARGHIEDAYFIGLVKKVYIKEHEFGVPLEVGVKPFIAYKGPDDLTQDTIKIVYDRFTSCSVRIEPGINEVIISKDQDGKYSLVRTDLIDHFEFWKELRPKARAVGKLR